MCPESGSADFRRFCLRRVFAQSSALAPLRDLVFSIILTTYSSVERYESAKLDGCSNLYFIVKILMPLTKSAIGAMAVYTFINAWNMYLWPLLVTGSDSMRTVQIGISMLNAVDAQSISLTMAGIVICMLPSLIIFVVGQKQMIRGMFSGAVKG